MLRNLHDVIADDFSLYKIISLVLLCKIIQKSREIKDFVSFINLY